MMPYRGYYGPTHSWLDEPRPEKEEIGIDINKRPGYGRHAHGGDTYTAPSGLRNRKKAKGKQAKQSRKANRSK
jgi:hypothetical protein